MELEEEFGITITDEDAKKISTVGDAIRLIQNRCTDPRDSA
jgi:acyl carrier protein